MLLLFLLSCQLEVDLSTQFLDNWVKIESGFDLIKENDEIESCYLFDRFGSIYSSDISIGETTYIGEYCIDEDNHINYEEYKLIVESETSYSCWELTIKSGLISLNGTACECNLDYDEPPFSISEAPKKIWCESQSD